MKLNPKTKEVCKLVLEVIAMAICFGLFWFLYNLAAFLDSFEP